jgi:ketosteroid isomerase-like protein
MMMQATLLSILLAFSVVGFAKAQETTGPEAEKAKQEIRELEDRWVQAMREGPSAVADYYGRYDADDIAFTSSNGNMLTKAQRISTTRADQRKLVELREEDMRIRIYGDANVGVVTAKHIQTFELNGKSSPLNTMATTVYVKKDGVWRSVVHSVHRLSTDESKP